MIFKIPDILEYTSGYMSLNEGDIFLMGTPSGVGPVSSIIKRSNKVTK